MRLFGSDRVAKLMDRMGLKEGEVIQHSMMTRSIECAQKKVEENNFGIRKRLLEYDNVIKDQRKVVYKCRYHVLQGERLKVDIANMIFDTCELIADTNKAANDYKNFEFEKNITLVIIDDAWKTHLRKMDELKQSVQLAVHEQKDPLLIYKFEAFKLFKVMIEKVNKEVISFLFKGELPTQDTSNIHEAREVRRKKSNYKTSKEEIPNSDELAAQSRAAGQAAGQHPRVTETIVRDRPKIGRNERVSIKNVMTGENKTLKYKVAEPLIEKGEWVLIEESDS